MEVPMEGRQHELADEIMKSIMSQAAARNLSNEEVINYETGAGNNATASCGRWQAIWRRSTAYRSGMTYELTASTLHRMCRIGWSARLS